MRYPLVKLQYSADIRRLLLLLNGVLYAGLGQKISFLNNLLIIIIFRKNAHGNFLLRSDFTYSIEKIIIWNLKQPSCPGVTL